MANLHSQHDKDDLILRLKRAEGQLRGVQNMILNDEECEKIAQQLSASRKALDRVFHKMIACIIQEQVGNSAPLTPAAQQNLKRITDMLTKFA
ncbi:MAG: metal-sensing transcriptional repressor [Pseudomonadota bacterium]|nr:metal-sensing transcriptional repressor [Pseudomonadota bacterium]